jgi:hypothetical protein
VENGSFLSKHRKQNVNCRTSCGEDASILCLVKIQLLRGELAWQPEASSSRRSHSLVAARTFEGHPGRYQKVPICPTTHLERSTSNRVEALAPIYFCSLKPLHNTPPLYLSSIQTSNFTLLHYNLSSTTHVHNFSNVCSIDTHFLVSLIHHTHTSQNGSRCWY